MGWRDRAAGHAILEEPDVAKLAGLPKNVAFQLRVFQFQKRKIWFVGTRVNLDKWEKDDDPFSEFAPSGSAKFVQLAAVTAAPFCRVFDTIHDYVRKEMPDSQYAGFGPSNRVGELSLGLQMATLLDRRVLSFINDDDPYEAMLACVSAPGQVVRARCEKAAVHFLFENGKVTIFQLPPKHPLTKTLGKTAKQPKGYAPGTTNQLVCEELNAFVGAAIADDDSVVPSYEDMKLMAQRAAGGKLKVFTK